MKTKGVGVTGLINVALIVLKLCGVIQISWFLLIPIMITIAGVPVIILSVLYYWFNSH